ncbi:N-acetyltransferase [Adlercreutzia sp. ZJ473]|uniref:GNAT family N-acetyltransferase n=1 Tax=Adlercreutzia sp. ZJ473 TaxID=2722822 RepID=UPI0015565079|nr:GNAT family N-acetyltransferase [Adlercreutzia sp. ZJ473]
MEVEFAPVETEEHVGQLAELAGEIWRDYWPALIGEGQTEYMIEQFQSADAIKRDMAENAYEYWFVRVREDGAGAEGEPRVVGYTGGHDEPETNRFFISKIYLAAADRGRGFASRIVAFYDELCRERGLSASYLTVNKHNELALRAYRAKGFREIDSVVTEIGGGYVMDDYVMERPVTSRA